MCKGGIKTSKHTEIVQTVGVSLISLACLRIHLKQLRNFTVIFNAIALMKVFVEFHKYEIQYEQKNYTKNCP